MTRRRGTETLEDPTRMEEKGKSTPVAPPSVSPGTSVAPTPLPEVSPFTETDP